MHAVSERIASTSNPDSAAVIVVLDAEMADHFVAMLAGRFTVVPFRHPVVEDPDALRPAQVGQMYRDACASVARFPEVWVVGRSPTSSGRRRAARFADLTAGSFRRVMFRDSIPSPQGTVLFSRWTNMSDVSSARRIELIRSLADAESILAAGIPKPTPLTEPFSTTDLHVDADSLDFYLGRLPDTSFYAIGGCSEVEIIFWTASNELGRLGPGVVPPLIERIDDSSAFVRERVQEALLYATQDERILARTNGEYLKFYDRSDPPSEVVRQWWGKFGHFWTPADSVRR